MKVTANLGRQETLTLHKAILLYGRKEHSGNWANVATIHDVAHAEGQPPQLSPGHALGAEALQDLAVSLFHQHETLELVPEKLIAYGIRGMAWWCPPGRQQLWFKPASKTDDSLRKISGETFPQPALFFLSSGHNLTVFALRGREKPGAKTPLYLAPYFNLSPDGGLCVGNARMPQSATPSDIPAYERAFFQSNFTHSNYGAPFVQWKGGHNALWAALKGKRTFPDRALVPLREGLGKKLKHRTVADVL